jgi:hypothetical protein
MPKRTWWPHSHVTWGLCCAHKWLLLLLKTPSRVNAVSSDQRCAPKSPDHFDVPVKATRNIGDGDDNHKAWDLVPVSSGMDTDLHPVWLNKQRNVQHPTLGQFLVYYDMDSVPTYPEPSLRVLVSGEWPPSSGGVGRTFPVFLILSSSRRNTLMSGWRRIVAAVQVCVSGPGLFL